MRVLWFVLLLPLVALSNPVPNSCIDKNPFLASMKNAKPLSVEILDEPLKKKFTHCDFEWNQFGSCCEAKDLVHFAELDAKLIDVNNAAIKDTFNQNIHQISSSLDSLKSKHSNNVEKVNKLKEVKKDFLKASDNCWDYMKKVRGSALCSICSGRSEHFFAKDKVLISPDTGLDAVSKCENFFTRLSQLKELLCSLRDLFLRHNISKQTREKLAKLQDDLERYSPPPALAQAFADHASSKANATASHHQASSICSMIMNVRKAPYITIMNHAGADAVAHKLVLKAETNYTQYIEKLDKQKQAQMKKIGETFAQKIKNEKTKSDHEISKIKNKMENSKKEIQTYFETLAFERKRLHEEADKNETERHAGVLNEAESRKKSDQESENQRYKSALEELNRIHEKAVQLEDKRFNATLDAETSRFEQTAKSADSKSRKYENSRHKAKKAQLRAELESSLAKLTQSFTTAKNAEAAIHNQNKDKEKRRHDSEIAAEKSLHVKNSQKELDSYNSENAKRIVKRIQEEASNNQEKEAFVKKENTHKDLVIKNLNEEQAQKMAQVEKAASEKAKSALKYKEKTLKSIQQRQQNEKQNWEKSQEQLKADISAKILKERSLLSVFSKFSRRLGDFQAEFRGEEGYLFESDSLILLKGTDNMFTSFVGATGTILSDREHCSDPMNMTLRFP